MSSARFRHSAQIDILLLDDCGIGEIRTLTAPFVKLLRAIVGLKKPAQIRQALGFVKWQRAQQQRIHHAEDPRIRADADRQR
jgi:hypothetical protein